MRFGTPTEDTVIRILDEGYKNDKRRDSSRKKKGEQHKDFVISQVAENLKVNKPQNYTDVLKHTFRIVDHNFKYETDRNRFKEWGGVIKKNFLR